MRVAATRAIELPRGVMPSSSAFSMIGAPCASSAQTKCTSCPCIRWKRTQMSAWMYSMMWPMWNGPFAYGSAVVTNSLRAAGDDIAKTLRSAGETIDSSRTRCGAAASNGAEFG